MQGRPERANRGKRPKPTQLQEQRDQAFYSTVFGADDDSGEDYEALKKPLSVVRGESLRMNLHGFPYSRSHHYYNDLSQLPRLGETNYVEDPNYAADMFHYHDQQLLQQYRNKGFAFQDVINRKYMGLPARQPKTGKSIHGDKNPCHAFLFNNEDRKWRIDQLLCELRYLKKNPQIVNKNKAKNYASVKRDPELSSLYDPVIPLQNKMQLLDTRITTLQSRKARLYEDFQFEDELFFHSSLNQKYFNDQSANELNVNNILSECMYLYSLSQQIRQSQPNQERLRKVALFFSVYSTRGLSNPILNDLLADFLENNIKSKIPPSYILDFSNTSDLQRTQQILSIRALQSDGETAFYNLKNLWKKVFNKELTFEKEYIPIKKDEYAEQMRKIVKNYKSIQIDPDRPSQATIPGPGLTQFLLGTESIVRLTNKQYMMIYLTYYIYQRVGYFNIEDKFIGSESFIKYQFKISELVGHAFAATLQPAIKQFVNVLSGSCVVPELDVDIFWEITNEKTGLIWMKEKEMWETQEEEEHPQSEHQDLEISMSEPSRLESYDNPSKRLRENENLTE